MGPRSVAKIVARRAAEAGLVGAVTPHCLRRSCASHMLAGGAHPAMVAETLGHASIKTLSHYLLVPVADMIGTHARTKPGK